MSGCLLIEIEPINLLLANTVYKMAKQILIVISSESFPLVKLTQEY